MGEVSMLPDFAITKSPCSLAAPARNSHLPSGETDLAGGEGSWAIIDWFKIRKKPRQLRAMRRFILRGALPATVSATNSLFIYAGTLVFVFPTFFTDA